MDENKRFEKYEYTKENISEDMLDYLIESKKQEIQDNLSVKKNKYYDFKYKYDTYNKEYTYSFDNFNNCDGSRNNPSSITNYEKIAFNTERLTVPKTFMQAIGTLEAVLLAELSRLSLYKPVNRYGFFCVSKEEIENDTGITAKQQDRLIPILENLGLIDTKSYTKQMRKFYRFNDDKAVELYWQMYRNTFKRVKYNKSNL